MNPYIQSLGINRFWGEMKPEIEKMNPLDELFDKCTKTTNKNGWLTIKCKLGFWSAAGEDRSVVERTAKNYWLQYFEDGEYDKLLKL